MNKKATIAQLLGLLITVVLTSAGILLLVQAGIITVRAESTESVLNTEFIPLGREGSLNLREFRFCGMVDAQLRCIEEKTSFKVGENVYVVFVVESSTYNGQVLLARNYRIKNPNGEVILDVDAKNNYNFDLHSGKEKELVTFADYFTLTDEVGEYSLDVIVNNALLDKKITATKRFKVE